eukprot:TRINITY_DN6139_c0_g2_i1.p1 TRINITY_DN6139_c0_g2~~TRINITY_DN6139_c0_g2_i1.p1  ORF type:complete len:435 (+),score=70.05 TRINITY_DN6139_c0_g2_i1:138-1442(+)
MFATATMATISSMAVPCFTYREPSLIGGSCCSVCGFTKKQHLSQERSISAGIQTTNVDRKSAGVNTKRGPKTAAAQTSRPASRQVFGRPTRNAHTKSQVQLGHDQAKANLHITAGVDGSINIAINQPAANAGGKDRPRSATTQTIKPRKIPDPRFEEAKLLRQAAAAAEERGDTATAKRRLNDAMATLKLLELEKEEDDNAEAAVDDGYRYDRRANEALLHTLPTARDMYLPQDMNEADDKLLTALGWGPARRAEAAKQYHRYAGPTCLSKSDFRSFVQDQCPGAAVEAMFRAMDRRLKGSWISSDDFVMAVACMHPNTPHTGGWSRVRNSAVFRYYATNSKQLQRKQVEHLCQDIVNHHLDKARQLVKQHIANEPSIDGDVPSDTKLTASVCTAVLVHVVLQGSTILTKAMYDRALSLKVLPQPDKLLRYRFV